ncbi:AAA family ATPase [Streptomyces sp. NBC_01433]|uniref:AAA family ATPase n=1 Tax=Streptomyces sp. NBC_01433 TaxID=2903864 RepID=UPI00224F2C57|nr:AAA family ATPase [Streptomyces sp. NBC_01433]
MITGPAGAGKSTLADAWARSRPTPTVHISLDDVRDWVKSGYANPEDGWGVLSERQYAVARRCVARAVHEYARIGYSCVVDDAVFPDWEAVSLAGWERELGCIAVQLVVLIPSLDALQERNSARSGRRRLSSGMIEIIHERMSGWRDSGASLIDNSHIGVDETVGLLNEVLRQG